jgi:hypothetical protein
MEMDVQGIICAGFELFRLAQDRDQRMELANTVVDFIFS